MADRVDNINVEILRECREQMRLTLADVERKVRFIAKMEQGKQRPTFNQLDILADMYGVPRWAFTSNEFPKEYRFDKAVPAFRQFSESESTAFDDPKVRKLITRVERCRNLIIELRESMEEPLTDAGLPQVENQSSPEITASEVRKWLGVQESLDFLHWKDKIEEKGIFVFMTTKHRGWSYIDPMLFRGLTISHSVLPIIIVNDRDTYSAQSFTLFHELGHLLRRESVIDSWVDSRLTEQWCDQLAGGVLMPSERMHEVASDVDDLSAVKRVAKQFKASNYACLVRLRQLKIVGQVTYLKLEEQLKEEYAKLKKERTGGGTRDRAREASNQYGGIYMHAVFQAYRNQEIGLHKLCKLFELKRVSHALQLEAKV